MKFISFWYVLLIVLIYIGSIHTRNARAATLSNDSYILQSNGINIENNITITPTAIPTPSKEEPPQTPFTFTVSPTLVDFGPLSPTNPIVRSVTFSISSAELGYSLFAIEDHEPKFQDKIIPDTACDNGICTNKLSAIWNSVLTYGFGYALNNDSFYKQFPNKEKSDVAQSILEKPLPKQTKVIYKINIAATQDIGVYQNITRFIAVPDF